MVNVNDNDIRVICMLYNLQSLVLSYCEVTEIPSEIGNLNPLRHLDLSGNRYLKELPESISDLHELRNLDVSRCESVSKLPQGIDRLINLKHLKATFLSFYDSSLKYHQGLAKLTSLQTLGVFKAGSDWSKLGLLNKLNRLSGSLHLQIKLFDDDDDIVEQAQEADLRKKMHLQHLTIEFDDRMDEENKEEDMAMRRRFDVMDALEPHPNLQSLYIRTYEGSKFSEWIVSPWFHQLRQIELFDCGRCLSLPHLGKLSCLEELEIVFFNIVELGREFLGITSSSSLIGFPKLKKLRFSFCSKWKEWDDITEEEEKSATVSIMPCLMELEISACFILRTLPHRLLRKASSLQRLRISRSNKLLVEAYKEELDGPLAKFISHIPNVEFFT